MPKEKSGFLLRIFIILIFMVGMIFIFIACPGKPYPSPVQTNSVTISEIAEAVASGVTTTTSGTINSAYFKPQKQEKTFADLMGDFLNPKAFGAVSSGLCATIQNSVTGIITAASSCTVQPIPANNDQAIALTWGPCGMSWPLGTWSGGETIRLQNSTTVLNCTGFPTFQAGDVLQRVFFIPTSRIANAAPSGVPDVTVLVDTSGNYSTFPPTTGWYYPVNATGEGIGFQAGGARQAIVFGIHLVGEVGGYITWDFTVSSSNPLSPSANPPPLSISAANVVTGTLYVQDNINQIVTQSVFGAMTYGSAYCGVPTGGTVTTTTLAGTYPPSPETLTFSSTCAAATIGATPVTLVHSF